MKTLALLACAACGSSAPQVAPPTGCYPAATADAPLVALFELGQTRETSLPTVAIWADGEVMGQHAEYGPTTAGSGRISPEAARDLARAVRTDLAALPDHSSISTDSDEPLTRIVVRDGNAWRVVAVYGFDAHSAEPAGMAAAVKRITAVRERLDAKWFPPQWELSYEEYRVPPPGTADDQPVQEETRPWPEGLPVPHGAADKAVIPAAQYPLVDGLDNHPALRDGVAWRIDAKALYRGEAVVEGAERCARKR